MYFGIWMDPLMTNQLLALW